MAFAAKSLDKPTDLILETTIEVDEASLHTDPSEAEGPANHRLDGGFVAWLQVACAFCTQLTTWCVPVFGKTYPKSANLATG